ncbi:MAG: spore maturation protein [Calditrichaeota bacterium]|nr:spore maturation protein [Calditrichota bacterium]
MALNYIWIAFFLIAFIVGLIDLIFFGNTQVFPNMVNATFDMSETAFKISINLTGIMAFWLGMMKIAEHGGMVQVLARAVGPFFAKIFPEIPKNHPAIGSIVMNFSANILGLDNAATPLGLKAMNEMQTLNQDKDTASNAMIMFLVLNTSAITVIPVSVMAQRAILGAQDPTDVFIPILIATFFSTFAGLLAVSIYQKINLFDRTIMLFLGSLTLIIATIIYLFSSMSQELVQNISTAAATVIIFTVIVAFIVKASIKKVNVYESFIEGAKEGFEVAVKIIPYLVAILVAIAVFRESGAMNYLISGINYVLSAFGIDTAFTPALPQAFMKPLSGGGARGMMIESMKTYGADSFVGRLSSIMQGSTETTFYIIAVYFGSVGIRKTRYAVPCGLIADAAGLTAAIFVAYLFFY